MKFIIVILVLIFLGLQYKLWFAPGGVFELKTLKEQINNQVTLNIKQQEKNAQQQAEVEDLKKGYESIEEHARNDLGMIKDNEVFYQLIEPESAAK